MRQNDSTCAAFKCVFHKTPRVDVHRVHTALGNTIAGKQLSLGIQARLIRLLSRHTEKEVNKILSHPLRGSEDGFLRPRRRADPAVQRHEQRKKRCSAFAHALHLLKLLDRGGKHSVK